MSEHHTANRAPDREPPHPSLAGQAGDAWLAAAAALAAAALASPGVHSLSESAAYQTRGRGPAVRGVRLARLPNGNAHVEVGLVVEAAVLGSRDALDQAVDGAAGRVRAAWGVHGFGIPLVLDVHVVGAEDVVASGPL